MQLFELQKCIISRGNFFLIHTSKRYKGGITYETNFNYITYFKLPAALCLQREVLRLASRRLLPM